MGDGNREFIARLKEENRNLQAMIDADNGRNPQSVIEWRERIERNRISIRNAENEID